MKLSSVGINNYRSIKSLEFLCDDYAVLIGPNNHGKSNVLKAIKAAIEHNTMSEQDFHNDEDEITIELTFNKLNGYDQKKLSRYLLNDEKIKVRVCWDKSQSNKIKPKSHGYIKWPSHPDFDQIWNSFNDGNHEQLKQFIQKTEIKNMKGMSASKIKEDDLIEAVKKYIDIKPETPTIEKLNTFTDFSGATGSKFLPNCHFVPAIQDANGELKIKTTTLFGKIFSDIIKSEADQCPELSQLQKNLTDVFEQVKTEQSAFNSIGKKIGQQLFSHWSGVNVNVEIHSPSITDIYDKCVELIIDDGVKGSLIDKGQGLQRATLFAMTKAWAATMSSKTKDEEQESLLYIIEEPELFLHPHAQQAFFHALKELASNSTNQVLICTHAQEFIDLKDYTKILIIEKFKDSGTTSRQVTNELFTLDEKHKFFNLCYWLNPDRSRMFFAKKVVLVEGQTEASVIPLLGQKLDVLNYEITIIDCGGKDGIPAYIKLCQAFNMNYFVLHDEDPTKAGEDVKNQKISDLINNSDFLAVAQPEFEKMISDQLSGSGRKKAIKAVEHIEGLTTEQIRTQMPQLCDLITKIYSVDKGQSILIQEAA